MKQWFFKLKMEELDYALFFLADKRLKVTPKQADAVKKKLKFIIDNLEIENNQP